MLEAGKDSDIEALGVVVRLQVFRRSCKVFVTEQCALSCGELTNFFLLVKRFVEML